MNTDYAATYDNPLLTAMKRAASTVKVTADSQQAAIDEARNLRPVAFAAPTRLRVREIGPHTFEVYA